VSIGLFHYYSDTTMYGGNIFVDVYHEVRAWLHLLRFGWTEKLVKTPMYEYRKYVIWHILAQYLIILENVLMMRVSDHIWHSIDPR